MEYAHQRSRVYGYLAITMVILHHIGLTNTFDTESEKVSGDYCVRESFHPSCGHNEVIVIHSAIYGRMSLGRCIPEDYGLSQYIGCQVDVLHLVERRCSGQQACSIPLPDHEFEATNPCNNAQLTSYLQVVHSCLPVVSATPARCARGDQPTISAPPSGYISSVTVNSTGCGTISSPWNLQAAPGQTIRINLVDFAYDEMLRPASFCRVYAVIKEPSAHASETVCGGLNKESMVYQSAGHTVELYVNSPQRGAFVLQYTFLGCADPRPLEGMTFTRSGNTGVWTCENTAREWSVMCEDGAWIGRMENCSLKGPQLTAKPSVGSSTLDEALEQSVAHFSWEMILILVAIVTVGMVTCVLIISIVCLKRSRARAGALAVPQYAHGGLYDMYDMGTLARQPSIRGAYCPTPEEYYQSLPKDYSSSKPIVEDTLSRDGRYHRPIWERPLPSTPLHTEFDA